MPKSKNTRTRKLPGPSGHGISRSTYTPTGVTSSTVIRLDTSGTQTTVSEGHHWPAPSGSDLSDRGGPFHTQRCEIISKPSKAGLIDINKLSDGRTGWVYTYNGVTYPYSPGLAIIELQQAAKNIASSDATLNKQGATAIARCKPTNSVADAATFLGELLKEGIPSMIGHTLWRDKTDAARKKAADEYLGIQFGWMPIVNEIGKFAEAVRTADKVLEQYERDAGKVVRRRYNFPRKREVSGDVVVRTNASAIGPNRSDFNAPPLGTVIRTRETVRDQWFSGAFTYYLPRGYDSRVAMEVMARKADKLLGISLTPEVLWNLAPWSWAVDWVTNTGDVVSNISDFASGGLVMRYGYMMEKVTITDTYWQDKSGLNDRSHLVAPLIVRYQSKKRVPANPFGFGLTWEGLSPFQLSILAALGISKGSR